jgi:nitrite reductase/ring-hydroxylating ferredoxin subunit
MGTWRSAAGRGEAFVVMNAPRSWVTLALDSAVVEGQARGFRAGGAARKIIVVRKDGLLRAYLDACPHYDGTPMAWRTDEYLSGDRAHLACHSHGARFDVTTGICVLGPCLDQRLTAVQIRNVDGKIQALVSAGHQEFA